MKDTHFQLPFNKINRFVQYLSRKTFCQMLNGIMRLMMKKSSFKEFSEKIFVRFFKQCKLFNGNQDCIRFNKKNDTKSNSYLSLQGPIIK